MSVWRNDTCINCRYIFKFLMKNLAHEGLMSIPGVLPASILPLASSSLPPDVLSLAQPHAPPPRDAHVLGWIKDIYRAV